MCLSFQTKTHDVCGFNVDLKLIVCSSSWLLIVIDWMQIGDENEVVRMQRTEGFSTWTLCHMPNDELAASHHVQKPITQTSHWVEMMSWFGLIFSPSSSASNGVDESTNLFTHIYICICTHAYISFVSLSNTWCVLMMPMGYSVDRA